METFGKTLQPAEPLLVLCLLAQRPSRPETELDVSARATPSTNYLEIWGKDFVTALRPLGTRAKKAADWQKTLIVRSEPFAVAAVILPHKQLHARPVLCSFRPRRPTETYLL